MTVDNIYILIDVGLILFAVLFKRWILTPLGFFNSAENKQRYKWFFIIFVVLFCIKLDTQEPDSISNLNGVLEVDIKVLFGLENEN